MSLAIQLVLALALLLAGFAGGVKFHVGVTAQKEVARQQAEAKALARQADRIETAAVKNEVAKEVIRTKYITIEREVNRVISQNPDYSRTCFSPDGLRQLEAAIDQSADTGQPATALPTAAKPD